MPGTNEAFSRVKIDAQLKDQGWDVLSTNAVRFEYVLPDRKKYTPFNIPVTLIISKKK